MDSGFNKCTVLSSNTKIQRRQKLKEACSMNQLLEALWDATGTTNANIKQVDHLQWASYVYVIHKHNNLCKFFHPEMGNQIPTVIYSLCTIIVIQNRQTSFNFQ